MGLIKKRFVQQTSYLTHEVVFVSKNPEQAFANLEKITNYILGTCALSVDLYSII